MATNFLEAAGTNGYIVTPFDLLSTESGLSALANGSAVTSSSGGTSGAFNQSNTGNAIWAEIIATFGGSFTPSAGGYLAGWFLRSKDGGSSFEAAPATASSSVPALPRGPDFIIPLDNAALASGNQKWAAGLVKLPFGTFKVVLQNMSGATANISHVTCAPVAIQY